MAARQLLDSLRAAGMAVSLDRDRVIIRPASLLTADLRASVVALKPGLVALLQAANSEPFQIADRPLMAEWDEDSLELFAHRVRKLERAGMDSGDAEGLADRLHQRDADGDDRVVCAVDCQRFGSGFCRAAQAAGVGRELGTLAVMLQRCPAVRRNGVAHAE